jgi:hypothetical protein
VRVDVHEHEDADGGEHGDAGRHAEVDHERGKRA